MALVVWTRAARRAVLVVPAYYPSGVAHMPRVRSSGRTPPRRSASCGGDEAAAPTGDAGDELVADEESGPGCSSAAGADELARRPDDRPWPLQRIARSQTEAQVGALPPRRARARRRCSCPPSTRKLGIGEWGIWSANCCNLCRKKGTNRWGVRRLSASDRPFPAGPGATGAAIPAALGAAYRRGRRTRGGRRAARLIQKPGDRCGVPWGLPGGPKHPCHAGQSIQQTKNRVVTRPTCCCAAHPSHGHHRRVPCPSVARRSQRPRSPWRRVCVKAKCLHPGTRCSQRHRTLCAAHHLACGTDGRLRDA